MIKTEMLVYLTEIAHYNSITAAAEALMVTPSAITHSLKNLRQELGGHIVIYERTSNGILFTETGEILVKMATAILKDLDRMKRFANNTKLQVLSEDLLPINSNIILCANLAISAGLSELPIVLYDRYPYVNFSIIDLPLKKMISNVTQDKEIFAVAYMLDSVLSPLTRSHHLDYEILNTTHLSIRAAHESKLVAPSVKQISWEQVSKLPIISNTYHSSLQEQLLPILFSYNPYPHFPLSSSNVDISSKIVEKDLAVSFAPGISFAASDEEADAPKFRTIPISGHLPVHIILLYNKKADLDTLRVLSYYLSHYLGNVYL